jgi:RimJ/RimL family protein N-acetyltransferase
VCTAAIRTGRVDLRPIAPRDAMGLARLLCEPEVLRWMPTLGPALSIDRAAALFEQSCLYPASAATVDLAAVRRHDGALLGEVSVESPAGDLQYWLGRAFWGCGYATEIVTAVTGFVLHVETASPLIASVHSDNLGSRRVLEKAGFRCTRRYWSTYAFSAGPVPVLDYRPSPGSTSHDSDV